MSTRYAASFTCVRRPAPLDNIARRDGPRLAWVRVGSEIVHVSAFSSRRIAERPEARCPVCDEPVILRLGDLRAHHAAHTAGSGCVLAHGESALHLNVKYHVASELGWGSDRPLVVRLRCAGRSFDESTGRRARCEATLDRELCAGWDAARIEFPLGGARPDVVLLRDGKPVTAIEVRATHAIDAPAASALNALGVPWGELRASRALTDSLAGWRLGDPLPVQRTSDTDEWRCPVHERRHRMAACRLSDGFRPWLARIVDVYRREGGHERDAFYMEAEIRSRRVIAVRLMHVADDDVIARVGAVSRAAAKLHLHRAFLRWVQRRRAAGCIVDSPSGWAPARRLPLEPTALRMSFTVQPIRYRFSRATARWERREG
jgi:hypothetical protein